MHAVLFDSGRGVAALPIFELDLDSDAPPPQQMPPIRVELEEAVRRSAVDELQLPDLRGVDLNRIPPGFGERDDRFLAHTLLPRAFSGDGSPASAAWNPLSSKLAELLLLDGPSQRQQHQHIGARTTSADDMDARIVVMHRQLFDSSSCDDDDAPLRDTSSVHAKSRGAHFPSVMCDSNELKQLVTAPFVDTKPLLMMVHRIGNTMLLDAGTIATNSDAAPFVTQPSSSAKQNRKKALSAKLVYFSIAAAANNADSQPREGAAGASSESAPPSSSPFFSQVMRWKFDDLSALVGMPAAPNMTVMSASRGTDNKLRQNRVSLLLRDEDDDPSAAATSPAAGLSKLEVMEHWLDNIIAAIPHVAVCTHRDGIVQGFQVIPTDQLPSLGGFEPVAVLQHSRDVLKWLQATTQDGNSYVLLKDPTATGSADGRGRTRRGALRLYCIRGKSASAAPMLAAQSATAAAAAAALPVPPTMADRRIADIDAVESSTASISATSAVVGAAAAEFDYPLAMLCFRMAQSLSVADAEAQRLFSECLALLHEDDATVAAFRAVALVSCAEHLRAASPLPDAETLSIRCARDAIAPLAIIFAQRGGGSVMPVAPQESAHDTAVRLTRQLLKLLTGFAAEQQQQRNSADLQRRHLRCMQSLALAQAVLMLRSSEIPSGLLTGVAPAEASDTTAAGPPAPARDRGESSFLLETMSSLSHIVGDLFHSLLETAIRQRPSQTQRSDNDEQAAMIERHAVGAVLKMAATTGQDVGLNVLRKFFPAAVVRSKEGSGNDEAFVFPPQIDMLGFLDNCSSDVNGLYEAASAAFSRAAALVVRERPESHREISRKGAALDNMMGVHMLESAQELLSAPAGSVGAARVNDSALQLLEESRRKFLSAHAVFTASGDETNSMLMIINLAKATLRRAEIGYRRAAAVLPASATPAAALSVAPLGLEELVALLDARDTIVALSKPEWLVTAAAAGGGGGKAGSPAAEDPVLRSLRLQFVQVCLVLTARCISVVGPGSNFSRDSTFAVLRALPTALRNRRELRSGEHRQDQQLAERLTRAFADPNVSVRKLLQSLGDFVFDEFASPALRVAKLVYSTAHAVYKQHQHQHQQTHQQQLAQAVDVAIKTQLLAGELLARFRAGVPFPGSGGPTAASSTPVAYDEQLSQQQQQLASAYASLRLAPWAEEELAVSADVSAAAPSDSSSSGAGDAATASHAATHFKLAATGYALPLAPAPRHGVVLLYFVDLQLRRARLLLLQHKESEACLGVCMEILSVLNDLAPWVGDAGPSGSSGLLSDAVALMVQQRLVSVLTLVLKVSQRSSGDGKDESAVSALRSLIAGLLQAAERTRKGGAAFTLKQHVLDAFQKLHSIFRTGKR